MRNMRKLFRILVSASFLIAVLFAAGCAKEQAAGDYKLTNMVSNGREYKDDLQVMKEMGLTASMRLNEDGTGIIQLFDETYVVSWNETAIRMEGIDDPYTLKKGVLVLTRGQDTLEFTRITDQ